MTSKTQDEESIFKVACRIPSADARGDYLRQACGDDDELLTRLQKMLNLYLQDPGFLEGPVSSQTNTLELPGAAPSVGSQVGPFKLREQLGEGGMGVVYVAEQTEPVKRRVALKIIRSGLATKEVTARFETERQALAMMDHPNIARVFDGGATDTGQPYFVMELVQGLPITEYCDRKLLSTHARLQLLITVCEAVHHAHQKGIIHRDLKPTNVLVAEIDGKAVPKVIDFGVAKAVSDKLTQQTLYTNFAQMVGTPLYMSPEQASMGVIDVDTRSDVYSLGVLLYELLTSRTPFDSDTIKKAGFDEMRRIIREDEPRRPSTLVSTFDMKALSTAASDRGVDARQLSSMLRGELDWLVMKSLEKDRGRRYGSAIALAEDVDRFLTNQPITARPPSTAYRFKKFAQRNKARLVPATIAAAVLFIGLTFATFAVLSERAEKEKLLLDTARRLHVSQVRQAATAWGNYDYGTLNEYLRNAAPEDDAPDFRGWEWYFLQDQARQLFAGTPQEDVIQAAWRPHHDHIAVCIPKGSSFAVEFWKPESRTRLRELIVLPNPSPSTLRWSDDGARLAIGSWDGRVTIVDATTGRIVFQRQLSDGDETFDSLGAIDLSPNGDRLVTATTFGNIKIWNFAAGGETNSLLVPTTGTSEDDENEKGVTSIAFSPDGNHLAARLKFGRVVTWDLRNGRPLDYERTGRERLAIEWHPTDQTFVSTDSRHISVYKAGKEKAIHKFRQLDAKSICWIDENVLATGGSDHTIRLWDMSKKTEIRSLQVVSQPVDVCGASPDGRFLAVKTATIGKLKVIRLDELLGSRHATLSPTTNDKGWNLVKWSPDGRFIASGHNDWPRGSTIRIFDVQQRKFVVEHSMSPNPKIDWSPDSESLQVVDSTGRIHTLGVAEPYVKLTRFPPDESGYFERITFHTFSDSVVNLGRRLIALDKTTHDTETESNELCIFDYEGLEVLDKITIKRGRKSWSPDGKCLCVAKNPNVLIYNLQQQSVRKKEVLTANPSATIAWNPDSSEVALGMSNGATHILDVETFESRTLKGQHRGPVLALTWSPDGARLASAAADGMLRIWDSVAGDEMAALHLPLSNEDICRLDWSPNGQQVAVASRTGEIFLLDAPTMPLAKNEAPRLQKKDTEDISPIQAAIASLRSSTKQILIDDFSDGDDEGWTHVTPGIFTNSGLASYDASSGAYQLTTTAEVAEYETDGGFVAAFWDKSADPIYSNGLVRAKVRVDSAGCVASIAFRISRERGESGYLFVANSGTRYKGINFLFIRIKDGQTVHNAKLGPTDLKFGVGEEWWIEAGGVGDKLSMKVWREGDPEPAAPQLIVIDDTHSSGLFGVATYIKGGFPRPAQIHATFDDISFTPLGRVTKTSSE